MIATKCFRRGKYGKFHSEFFGEPSYHDKIYFFSIGKHTDITVRKKNC